MNRILENRVAKMENLRRLRGDYADWTDEELQRRIDELGAILVTQLDAATDNGKVSLEVVFAVNPDWSELSEQERSHLRTFYDDHLSSQRAVVAV